MTKSLFERLRVTDWPELDRSLWQESLCPADPFGEAGRAATWRPSTITAVEKAYGTFLWWLAREGLLEPAVMPSDRISEETIRSFLQDYSEGRAPLSVAAAVRGIAYAIRAIAPSSDGLPWLTKLAHHMVNTGEPSRPKLPRMASSQELWGLAENLMQQGRIEMEDTLSRGAVLFRDGLIIACLVFRPVRLRNLVDFRIGETLFEKNGRYWVRFDTTETKKGVPIEFVFPYSLSAHIAYYLNAVRPVLLKEAKNYAGQKFWLGRRGRPLSGVDLSTRIANLTEKHLGRRCSPHLFRDAAATAIAVNAPEHVGITKSVLGHATLASSQNHYNQAQSFAAIDLYGATLDKLSKGLSRN